MTRILFVFAFLAVFIFMGAPQAQAQALTSGSTATGSLAPFAHDTYTFTGSAGEGVILQGHSTAYGVRITVYRPGGALWKDNIVRVQDNLPDSGTYTVEVRAAAPSLSGAYSLFYLRGGDTVSGGTLTSGGTKTSSLVTNGLDSYQFSGTAGQSFIIYGRGVSTTSTLNIRIYKPDGSFWTTAGNRLRETLPDTGTYTVAIMYAATDASGDYKLYYVRGDDTVSSGSLASGLNVSGLLDNNEVKSYTFKGTAGDGVLLYAKGPHNTEIRVYKPDGSFWGTHATRFTGTLPSSGVYTVTIAYAVVSATGDYNLYYLRGNSSVSDGGLVSGKTRSGALAANEIVSYKFSGIASNNLSISTSGSFTRTMNIYKPDGSFWLQQGSSISQTLPDTGEYTLALTASTTSATGGYSITLTTPPQVTSSDPEQSNPYQSQSCAYVPGSPSPTVGNPINFDLGYKIQTEQDYRGGAVVVCAALPERQHVDG